MTVFELMNILKNYPAGSSVKITKWNARKEETETYDLSAVELSDNEEKPNASETVWLSMGEKVV